MDVRANIFKRVRSMGSKTATVKRGELLVIFLESGNLTFAFWGLCIFHSSDKLMQRTEWKYIFTGEHVHLLNTKYLDWWFLHILPEPLPYAGGGVLCLNDPRSHLSLGFMPMAGSLMTKRSQVRAQTKCGSWTSSATSHEHRGECLWIGRPGWWSLFLRTQTGGHVPTTASLVRSIYRCWRRDSVDKSDSGGAVWFSSWPWNSRQALHPLQGTRGCVGVRTTCHPKQAG